MTKSNERLRSQIRALRDQLKRMKRAANRVAQLKHYASIYSKKITLTFSPYWVGERFYLCITGAHVVFYDPYAGRAYLYGHSQKQATPFQAMKLANMVIKPELPKVQPPTPLFPAAEKSSVGLH